MAKACAKLCRQCCCIDGFGEFGEKLFEALETTVYWTVVNGALHQVQALSWTMSAELATRGVSCVLS